jgi:uncharacterized protein YbbC (DUF1343 family)
LFFYETLLEYCAATEASIIYICKNYNVMRLQFIFLVFPLILFCRCATAIEQKDQVYLIRCGAERTSFYLPLIEGKKVGLVVNQTSQIFGVHLVDTLRSLGVQMVRVFAPEHGFRGEADAGASIKDDRDLKTGIPIISLYGSKKKPSREDLHGIEYLVFDIQDVGARFYTYISTMHYVMEACAEFGIPFLVLDRPNPNGFYVDGPVLKTGFSSFVGMHPIPVVHGLTVGELAQMIKGEKWIKQADDLELKVIPCEYYTHAMLYDLPVRPSPNLPNQKAILWYPSTCFFEGTPLSLGRGTDFPFQWIGHPEYPDRSFAFVPKSRTGASDPPLRDKQCYGRDYSSRTVEEHYKRRSLDLEPLLHFYKSLPLREQFFLKNGFFDKLAGTDELRLMILSGAGEEAIRASWQKELDTYKKMRQKYLLYPDFK